MRYLAKNTKAKAFKAIRENIYHRIHLRELGFKG